MCRNKGIYSSLSNEEYHADKDYISRSQLMDFEICPYVYWAKHINPDRPMKESTPAMELGSAFHLLILESHKFEMEYEILPAKVLLKDVGREKYNEFKKISIEAENSGKKLLSYEEWKILSDMRSKFESNLQAVELIQNARIEHSLFWQDNTSELLIKARPDILHENMIVDLKTCADASPKGIQNAMFKGGYHLQGAMIQDGVYQLEGHWISTVINICIENKYPYNMGIYLIDEATLDYGREKYKNILVDLKSAIAHNKFDDFGIHTIGLPRWAL